MTNMHTNDELRTRGVAVAFAAVWLMVATATPTGAFSPMSRR